MPRINRATGQENDASYMVFVAVHLPLKEKVMHTDFIHALYMPMVALLSVSLTGLIAMAWFKKHLGGCVN
jgi:hypothetical protein